MLRARALSLIAAVAEAWLRVVGFFYGCSVQGAPRPAVRRSRGPKARAALRYCFFVISDCMVKNGLPRSGGGDPLEEGVFMARRSKMSRGNSKKVFTKAAQRVHPANSYRPMRGGIRL